MTSSSQDEDVRRERAAQSGRGRGARRPIQVPPTGWKDVLLRTKDEIKDDEIAVSAGAVAFFAMLTICPALVALVSLYGLVFDPQTIQSHLDVVSGLMPSDALSVLQRYLETLTGRHREALSLAAVLGALVGLWSASNGTALTMKTINAVYDEDDRRSFLRSRAVALGLTLAFIVIAIVAMSLLAAMPVVLRLIGLVETTETLIRWLRWPLLLGLGLVGLALLYRFAPDRRQPKWRWVTVGSLTAVTLWLIASLAFSFFASSYDLIGRTYGPLASVIVLMLWFYLSAFAVLLGAEVNSEIEAQTKRDSTRGSEKPMGERGAYKADTLGEARGQ